MSLHFRYYPGYAAALRRTHSEEGPRGCHKQGGVHSVAGDITDHGAFKFKTSRASLIRILAVFAGFSLYPGYNYLSFRYFPKYASPYLSMRLKNAGHG